MIFHNQFAAAARSQRETLALLSSNILATSTPSTASTFAESARKFWTIFMSPPNLAGGISASCATCWSAPRSCGEKELDSRALACRGIRKTFGEGPERFTTIKFSRFGTTVDAMERELILHTLNAYGNNKTRAPNLLGIRPEYAPQQIGKNTAETRRDGQVRTLDCSCGCRTKLHAGDDAGWWCSSTRAQFPVQRHRSARVRLLKPPAATIFVRSLVRRLLRGHLLEKLPGTNKRRTAPRRRAPPARHHQREFCPQPQLHRTFLLRLGAVFRRISFQFVVERLQALIPRRSACPLLLFPSGCQRLQDQPRSIASTVVPTGNLMSSNRSALRRSLAEFPRQASARDQLFFTHDRGAPSTLRQPRGYFPGQVWLNENGPTNFRRRFPARCLPCWR